MRRGVALMFRADSVTSKDLSYDPDNPAKGVRIFEGLFPATETPEPDKRKLVLPQLLVSNVFASTRWTYGTQKTGEKRISITISLLVAINTSYHDIDAATWEATAEARFSRFERVLQLGTLIRPDMLTNRARVADPFRSPLLVGGTYDPASIRYLNNLAPDMTRTLSMIPNIAVAYSLRADYTVDVSNREEPAEGGF